MQKTRKHDKVLVRSYILRRETSEKGHRQILRPVEYVTGYLEERLTFQVRCLSDRLHVCVGRRPASTITLHSLSTYFKAPLPLPLPFPTPPSLHNLHPQILRPHRLINSIPPDANIIPQLHPFHLCNRRDLHKRPAYNLAACFLEEVFFEESFGVVFVQEGEHAGDCVAHAVQRC